MRQKVLILFFICTAGSAGTVSAQHWKQVFTIPSIGSAAYFFNPDAGCIGTGTYPSGYPAQIYYTTDGGNSWTRSLLPNMDLFGQVTDIYFTDRFNGWATIRERIEHGWSGVYRTTDGGKSWALWFQAEFPVSIRETSRGIFFTDRFVGIHRSTDGGKTFPVIAASNGILGLDFLDDNIGIASSEGTFVGMVLITTDGGTSWNTSNIPHEAWTAYADVATRQLLLASERNVTFTGSGIFSSNDNGISFAPRFTGPVDIITGGIAGPRWCRSVIFAQGQDSTTKYPGVTSMIRSLDGGLTWIRVGGPDNYNDKRFAVTGKGAVVYTFDKGGGVWKTSDGGDGTLTASALGRIFITNLSPTSLLSSKLCDSADYQIQFTYSDCDSLIISGVAFLDDNFGELSAPKRSTYFGKDNTRFDTLVIRLKPRQIHLQAERIRVTLRQPDGFTQDTVVQVNIQGLAARDIPLITEAPGNAMDFGSRSVCGDDSVRTLTIANFGCAPMNVTSLTTDGPPFNLLSSFQPFSLDPGATRTILLQFQPTVFGPQSGKLHLVSSDSTIAISLTGTGIAGTRGYKLSQPLITSTICDSAEGDLIFKNISCTPVALDSIGVDSPFHFDKISLPLMLGVDSVITLHFHFVPNIEGPYTRNITIHSFNDKDSNNRFDTTLTLTALATRGLPDIALTPASLDFGSINTCIYRDSGVTITNTGCDTLKISGDVLIGTATGYTLLQSSKGRNILRGESTKILIRFKPPGLGTFNTTIHLSTTAGDRDILLTGNGTNDPGTFAVDATPIGSVLTCKDSGFALTLSNTTCDSLFLDSVVFSGAASPDYSINSFSGIPMPSGASAHLQGKFTPQANGIRSTVAHCYLHLSDGTLKEITVPLDGIGIQPVVIQLSLPNITLTGLPGADIRLPIQLLDTSIVPVAGINISMNLNTNLLEPESFDMAGSVINGASIQPLTFSASGVSIQLQVPVPQKLSVGLLGTLLLHPFVSDSDHTNIILVNFSAFDSTNSNICLPTSVVTPPQIVTNFILTKECGDSTLSGFLSHGTVGLAIEHIAPNPASSSVTVTIRLPADYRNDGVTEIFDALGNLIQRESLLLPEGEKRIIRTIELKGASGLRLLRVRTPQGSCSESIYLLK